MIALEQYSLVKL